MVYHDPFRRLVLSGTLYGLEAWSIGVAMGHVGLGEGGNPENVSEGIQTACEGFIQNNFTGSNAKLTTIKYNFINVAGHYDDPGETIRYDYDTPVGGTGGASNIPQSSLVVSLNTAFARGRGHAGRYYMPAFSAPLDSDGRISVDVAALVAEYATTFLNALNADDEHYRVCVVSNIGAGVQHEVTHVRVGRVIDTMRSRRTSLVEDYQAGAALA